MMQKLVTKYNQSKWLRRLNKALKEHGAKAIKKDNTLSIQIRGDFTVIPLPTDDYKEQLFHEIIKQVKIKAIKQYTETGIKI